MYRVFDLMSEPNSIGILEDIEKELEKCKEYKPTTTQLSSNVCEKENRMKELSKTVIDSKIAAEKLLGFTLKREHFINGQAYMLLPVGYVNRPAFEERIKEFQKQILDIEMSLKKWKEDLIALNSGDLKAYGCVSLKEMTEQRKRSIQTGSYQLFEKRSKFLGYLMTNLPMNDETFTSKLTEHLDTMLDAYLELRTLESL